MSESPKLEELALGKNNFLLRAVKLLATWSRGRLTPNTSVEELLTLLLSIPLSTTMIRTGGSWQVPLSRIWVYDGAEISEILVTLNCRSKKIGPGKTRALKKIV